MKASKYLIFRWMAVICVAVTLNGFAQNAQEASSVDRVGTTAAQFLKIGVGARPIALGGAYTAMANDILSIYWNPAGLSRVPGSGEAAFTHAEWLAQTDFDFAAFSLNLDGMGSVGVHVLSFRTPEEIVRTVDNPDGTGQTWEANSIALGLTYAISLTDQFSIGFSGKYLQESIFNLTAQGAAFDLGILYNTPLKGLTLGATISNFGTKMRLDGRDLFFNEDPLPDAGSVDQVPAKFRTDSYDLPLNLKFGLAWEVMNTEQVRVLAVADGVQPNDNSEYLNSGVEIGIQNVIFLRGGYKALLLENSEQGLTFGAGIQYDRVGTDFKFDFGWADYGRLNDVKFVSFSVRY